MHLVASPHMGHPPPGAGEAWVADRRRQDWADRPRGWAEVVQVRAESPCFLHPLEDSWSRCRPFGLPFPPDRPTRRAQKSGRSADGVDAPISRRFPHAALPPPGPPPDPPPRQQSRHRRRRRTRSPHLVASPSPPAPAALAVPPFASACTGADVQPTAQNIATARAATLCLLN